MTACDFCMFLKVILGVSFFMSYCLYTFIILLVSFIYNSSFSNLHLGKVHATTDNNLGSYTIRMSVVFRMYLNLNMVFRTSKSASNLINSLQATIIHGSVNLIGIEIKEI